MKNIKKEASKRFSELLKEKPHIYDEEDRKGFISGWVEAEICLLCIKSVLPDRIGENSMCYARFCENATEMFNETKN